MSQQPLGDPSAGATNEEPPPLETVDPGAANVMPHLAENVPLRRAPEGDVSQSRPAGNGNFLSTEDATAARRKNTSFKITNILPSRPPSNDPDESGEDDPDDSRTEDISDNVDEANVVGNAAAGRRPSIQTLGRFGSVQGEVTATMYPISELGFVDGISGVSTPGQGPVHGPKDRFKVVKIETAAPQRRGRWTCIEYADKQSTTSAAPTTTTTTTAPPTSELPPVSVSESYEAEVFTQQPTQLPSPTVQQAALGAAARFPQSLHEETAEHQHVPIVDSYPSAVAPTVSSSIPTVHGATYSTSPVPFATTSTAPPSGVASHQQTPPPVAIYTSSAPSMSAQVTAVSMSQPMVSMSQSQALPPTNSLPQQLTADSSATAMRSQRSVPTNLQGFDGYVAGGGQVVPGVQSPSGQLPTNPHHTYSGTPSSSQMTHPTITQQAYVTQLQQQQQQQQSPLQPPQFQQPLHPISQSQYQNIAPPQQQQYQPPTSQSQQQQQLMSQPPTSIPLMPQQQQQHNPQLMPTSMPQQASVQPAQQPPQNMIQPPVVIRY